MAPAGHYVVICGYDAATDEFEIRDPASSRFRLFLLFFEIHYLHFFCRKACELN